MFHVKQLKGEKMLYQIRKSEDGGKIWEEIGTIKAEDCLCASIAIQNHFKGNLGDKIAIVECYEWTSLVIMEMGKDCWRMVDL
jgi:hypothetical protein